MTTAASSISLFTFLTATCWKDTPRFPNATIWRATWSTRVRRGNVERALDWLADLADVRAAKLQPMSRAPHSPSLRLFSDGELARLSTESRGFLLHLERHGILSPLQREVVIDRLLALDAEELDTEQIKWVVLMVLSSQPGQEQAFARMEDLVLTPRDTRRTSE